MKATYRTFSKHPLLLGIASFLFLITVVIIGRGIQLVLEDALQVSKFEALSYIFILLVIMLAVAWFLSCSLLPIVRINGNGITAYLLFWTRSIFWENVKTLKLLKVENNYNVNGTKIHFDYCKVPETKNSAILNKGIRVATYIIVSDRVWQKPADTITMGLYGHKKIAGKHAIAFQFDQQAWEIINNRAFK